MSARKDIVCWRPHDINYGNPQTCLDLEALATAYPGDGTMAHPAWTDCGQFVADGSILTLTCRTLQTLPRRLHLPNGAVRDSGARSVRESHSVGLRPYSSPQCDPTDWQRLSGQRNPSLHAHLCAGHDCQLRLQLVADVAGKALLTWTAISGGLYLEQVH